MRGLFLLAGLRRYKLLGSILLEPNISHEQLGGSGLMGLTAISLRSTTSKGTLDTTIRGQGRLRSRRVAGVSTRHGAN